MPPVGRRALADRREHCKDGSEGTWKDHVARTVSLCFRQLRLLRGCFKSLPFEAARAAQQPPLIHRKSIAATVCWLVHVNAFWIACSLSTMLPPGCCAIVESTIMLHHSSVMFCTGS